MALGELAGHVHLPADGTTIRVWTGQALSGVGPLDGIAMTLRPAMVLGSTVDAWVSEGGKVAPAGGRVVLCDPTWAPEACVEHLVAVDAWGVERWTRVDGSPSPNVLCRCVSPLAVLATTDGAVCAERGATSPCHECLGLAPPRKRLALGE